MALTTHFHSSSLPDFNYFDVLWNYMQNFWNNILVSLYRLAFDKTQFKNISLWCYMTNFLLLSDIKLISHLANSWHNYDFVYQMGLWHLVLLSFNCNFGCCWFLRVLSQFLRYEKCWTYWISLLLYLGQISHNKLRCFLHKTTSFHEFNLCSTHAASIAIFSTKTASYQDFLSNTDYRTFKDLSFKAFRKIYHLQKNVFHLEKFWNSFIMSLFSLSIWCTLTPCSKNGAIFAADYFIEIQPFSRSLRSILWGHQRSFQIWGKQVLLMH